MNDYLNGIDEGLWRSIDKDPFREDRVQVVGIVGQNEDMIALGNTNKAKDKRYIHELHEALPSIVYHYIRGCKTAQEI